MKGFVMRTPMVAIFVALFAWNDLEAQLVYDLQGTVTGIQENTDTANVLTYQAYSPNHIGRQTRPTTQYRQYKFRSYAIFGPPTGFPADGVADDVVLQISFANNQPNNSAKIVSISSQTPPDPNIPGSAWTIIGTGSVLFGTVTTTPSLQSFNSATLLQKVKEMLASRQIMYLGFIHNQETTDSVINNVAFVNLHIPYHRVPSPYFVKNSFNAGRILVEGVDTISGTKYTWLDGTAHPLGAIDQTFDSYNRVWNVSGAPDGISRWAKQLPRGSSLDIPNALGRNYTYIALKSDSGASIIAGLKRVCDVHVAQKAESGNPVDLGIVATVVEGNPATVTAPSQMTIGGTSYPFVGWSDGRTSNPLTFTVSQHTYLTAIYKGVHISDNPSTWASSNQRKFVQTPDGWLHLVYESFGRVYYENKPPNGDWQIFGGRDISNGTNAKSPAIDFNVVPGWGNMVAIVYQVNGYIVLTTYLFNGTEYVGPEPGLWLETNEPYANTLNPNVAWGPTGMFMILWEGKYYPGIHYQVGRIYQYNMGFGVIPGTDANSINAAISTDKLYDIPYFDVAWQQYVSPTTSTMKWCNLAYGSQGIDPWPVPAQTISYGAAVTGSYVSVVSLADGPRIGWWSHFNGFPFNCMTLFDPVGSHYWLFDMLKNNIRSTSLARIDDNSGFYLGWSRTDINTSNLLVSSANLAQLKYLNTTGKEVQLCNGQNPGIMYGSAFYNSTPPYYFLTSNSFASFPKLDAGRQVISRGCTVAKDSAAFDYSIGDIRVNESVIGFIPPVDSIRYNNLFAINEILETEPFQAGYALTFNEYSLVGDSASIAVALSNGSFLSFSVLLVD